MEPELLADLGAQLAGALRAQAAPFAQIIFDYGAVMRANRELEVGVGSAVACCNRTEPGGCCRRLRGHCPCAGRPLRVPCAGGERESAH